MICTDPAEMKAAAGGYFYKLFRRGGTVHFNLDAIPFKYLSSEQASLLTCAFSEVEIFSRLMDYGSSKALGQDGFNFLFYKNAWKVLRPDILALFNNFYGTG